jgi:predicted adenine nucleotide alpha hydrolase (AANH) superfamily ATPase
MQDKSTLLLHVCCAPCSIAVIDELRQHYSLTVLFYNPNIHPAAEYQRRKDGVIQVCDEWSIPMLDHDYNPQEWHDRVRGLEGEPEGGRRCGVCIGMRLSRVAQYAANYGFPMFATTLTSGRNKKAELITPIAEKAALSAGVRYLAADWKKGGREEKARKMIRERGIYRQNYCGCVYSLRASETKERGNK